MPLLVLLNGGPASGKSTLAHLWAQERPLALSLLDVLRAMIADWERHPVEAGLRTRDLALTMIGDHLAHERDVIVPQFLANTTFIDQLQKAAMTSGAQFVEVVLLETPEIAERRVRDRAARAERSGSPNVVHGSLGTESMQEVVQRHREFIDSREQIVRVTPVDGDVDASLDRLRRAIDARVRSADRCRPAD
ncbi:AAA family ATPase [Leifsonia sp. SIMBA_070]